MPVFDYSDDLAGVIEDIHDTGRPISMIRDSELASDPTKPLHGSQPSFTITGVFATFVEPSSIQRLGSMAITGPGLWRDCEQVALVEPITGYDFTTFTAMRDTDGSEWKIKAVHKLKPGDLTLLYYVGVAR